jgi:integrase
MRSTRLYLYKRSNGYWYIGYHDNGRKRWKSTNSKLKNDALRALVEFSESPASGPSSISLSEFIIQFCELRSSDLRGTTIQSIYLPAFRSFQSVCGDRPLAAYSLKDVELYKSQRLRSCAPTTVNIEFRSLRAAFACAVKWQLLQDNPFAKSSRVRVPERLPVYFSKDEFNLFLSFVREQHLKDLFLFAALTGLRQGEILSLEWTKIDLERRLIIVANSNGFLTKSGKCRAVPMSDYVFGLLSRRSLAREFSDKVFHRQGKELTQSYVEHKFKRYLRQARLNDDLRFHSLRHTFATWLVQSGVGLYEVQKLLGHSDARTTQMYSHLVAGELHAAVNKILPPLN